MGKKAAQPKPIELRDGIVIPNRMTVGVYISCEEEIGKPFGLVNWMFMKNQIIFFRAMANYYNKEITNEQIQELFEAEIGENGSLERFQNLTQQIFEADEKVTKKEDAEKKK